MFQFTRLQDVRPICMATTAIVIMATTLGHLRGDDTSNLSEQSLEVLQAVEAGLWGQGSLDDEGNVSRVRIKQPNKERLERLVRTFPSLSLVFFDGVDDSLAPEDLKCFESLRHLERLWFLSPLTDEWAMAISRFPKLQELHLSIRLGFTERGFSALSALKEVKTLSLDIGYEKFYATEDELGAAVLRQFPNVKTLTLSGGSVSSRTLLEVGQHLELRAFRFQAVDRRLKNEDFAALSRLKDLEEVVLPAAAAPHIESLDSLKRAHGFTDIRDEGLRHFSGLKSLEEVDLDSKHLTDQALIHLRGVTALTTLRLHCTKLDGSGLTHLAGCKQLRRLVLRQTNFQPQSVDQLTAFTALEYLDLGWTPMSDGENWQSLSKLKVLRNLKELQVELGEPDRSRLSEALPGVSIYCLE